MKVNSEDNRRKGINIRRSILYSLVVKDNPIRFLNQFITKENINFESESMEQADDQKSHNDEEIFTKLANTIFKPEPQNNKLIETLRLSFQVQLSNLATKFKTVMKDILERKLIELKTKFESDCHKVMSQFFDLKASLYEKEMLFKILQNAICDAETLFSSKNNALRRPTLTPLHNSSNITKEIQLENMQLKEELEQFRIELDRLKQRLNIQESEITRLKEVEQQKLDGDRRMNDLFDQLRENERKFSKLQQTQRLNSPLKVKKKGLENKEKIGVGILDTKLVDEETKIEQTTDMRQSQEMIQKLLQESRFKEQNTAQFSQRLKERIKDQSEYIARLEEKLVNSEKIKQQQFYNPKYFNDLLLNQCFTRPSTSVNYYYNAPQMLTQQTQAPLNMEFKLEKLVKSRKISSPTKYEFDSQGFVTKIEKLSISMPLSTRQQQQQQITLLDIKGIRKQRIKK